MKLPVYRLDAGSAASVDGMSSEEIYLQTSGALQSSLHSLTSRVAAKRETDLSCSSAIPKFLSGVS
jgi:hypothetical protein